MKGMIERGRAVGAKAVAARRAGIAAELAEVPGVTARIEGEDVVIEGQRLLHRWVEDARLRYAASVRR